MRRLLVIPAVLALLCGSALCLSAQETRDAMEMRAWIHDVRHHEPGRPDEYVSTVAARPWMNLRPLLERVIKRRDPALLLRSAALLADVALLVPVDQRPHDGRSGAGLLAQDGERRGTMRLDSHIWWARRLVDSVVSDPRVAGDTVMRAHGVAWYRAVSAVFAARHNLADLKPHVEGSLEQFPDDAGILFDAGSFSETFASPAMQAAMADREKTPSNIKPADLLRTLERSRSALLADAERHFRRAVERDPGMSEARVRLGRVLTLRGKPADAVTQLRRGLESTADSHVRYYALLFLGGALEASGDGTGAMRAYRSAAGIFPDAQSPRLAISHLEAEDGNPAASRAVVDVMLETPIHPDDRFDPWWVYHRASGRDAEAIYEQFATRMRQLPIPAVDVLKIK